MEVEDSNSIPLGCEKFVTSVKGQVGSFDPLAKLAREKDLFERQQRKKYKYQKVSTLGKLFERVKKAILLGFTKVKMGI